MNSNLIENYSAFVRWIANLGVVPLLLFAAFLLLPIFTFLLALLFLVTLVFETIFQLLSTTTLRGHILSLFNKAQIILTNNDVVKKEILLLLLFFKVSATYPLEETSNQILTHTITIGQLLELDSPNLIKYTVGNKKTIRVKNIPPQSSLLIKGLGLGQSDLMLWIKGQKSPILHQVFVVQKTKYLKLKEVSLEFEKIGLISSIKGGKILLDGTLSKQAQYLNLIRSYNEHRKRAVFQDVNISKSLKLSIWKKFLFTLQRNDLLDLDCHFENLFIICKGSKKIQEALKELRDQYLLKWDNELLLSIGKQYEITLILQQFENAQGRAFNFGLSKIEGKLESILFQNPLGLIDNNSIQIKKSQFKSQTLATPKIVGRINSPIQVRIGQQIPFLQNVTTGIATQQWKFAGLSIDLQLQSHTDKILVDYKTNISRPAAEGIGQNMQKSSALISLDKSKVLFDIGLNVGQHQREALPILSKIPVFGSLFAGNQNEKTFKRILCLILIKEL